MRTKVVVALLNIIRELVVDNTTISCTPAVRSLTVNTKYTSEIVQIYYRSFPYDRV